MTSLLSTPAIQKMRGSQPLREAMAAILADPTMQKALDALATATTPTSIPSQISGVHHDTTIAHEFHRMLGVAQTLNTLRALGTAVGAHEQEASIEGTEFTHALPPELRKKPTA